MLRLQNIRAGLFDDDGRERMEHARLCRYGTRQQVVPSVWHEFLNVLGVLNMDVRKEFADHLMGLQKDPDRYFVEAPLQVYENNRAMVDILHNLSHPPAQPLEPYSIGYFSNPGSYKYYVKGSDETFQSYESDHQKAYRKHMKNKLHEHLNKLI